MLCKEKAIKQHVSKTCVGLRGGLFVFGWLSVIMPANHLEVENEISPKTSFSTEP